MVLEISGCVLLYILGAAVIGLPRAISAWKLHDESKLMHEREVSVDFVRCVLFPWSTILEILIGFFDLPPHLKKKGLAQFFKNSKLYIAFTSFLWPVTTAVNFAGVVVLLVVAAILTGCSTAAGLLAPPPGREKKKPKAQNTPH